MSDYDPIALMYGGLEKLAPGDDKITREVLQKLPRREFQRVVDVGCGSGRQTLVLARALNTVVHALDNFAPFLEELDQKARTAGLSDRVQTHCMDMADLAGKFQRIDLLWAEGSAYNLGFASALETWAPALAPGGFLVASELSWLTGEAPERVRVFWQSAYPGMGTVAQNCQAASNAGYRLLDTYTLSRESWVEGFYDILGPRAESLRDHEDAGVRAMAAENLEEIAVFNEAADSYGYVFYSLQRP
jgi:trans-aconitate methyltransferase